MKNHASMLAALGTIVCAVLSQDLPPLTSDGLRGLITADALMAKAKVFEDCAYATPARNRFVGTTGLDTSLQWVYDTLTALDYYDVKKQKFTVNRGGSASFSVAGKTYTTATFDGSPAGEADGKLVPVANLGCSATDFPSSVSGAIALVARGTCGFADKARFAGAAGAKAVVIYNNVAQGAAAGGLGSGTFPPTVGINQADGQALVAAGQGQEGSVSVTINTVSTYNIIAQTRSGDTANVLQLGAHMDSVEVCPGVNDDGSGSIGILETAIQLAKFQPPKNTSTGSMQSMPRTARASRADRHRLALSRRKVCFKSTLTTWQSLITPVLICARRAITALSSMRRSQPVGCLQGAQKQRQRSRSRCLAGRWELLRTQRITKLATTVSCFLTPA
ncbi:hypothetical protein MCOR25_003716 [Pyricularia grisea]|nr:hypothetical protein MCOR25_003716 [Pyricularia grisea]